MKHLNMTITGKVQGVFFREEAKKKAEELGIRGFVRNEELGSVYIEAEGEESLLEEYMNWVKAGGPELAFVDEVSSDISDELSKFEEFNIRI